MADPTTDTAQQTPPEEDVNAQWKAWLETPVEGDESEVENERRGAPVRSFWQKLLRGDGENNRLKEVGRSVVRGAVTFANESANTADRAAAFIDRKTGLGERMRPGFNEKYDSGQMDDMRPVKKARMDEIFGRRSDDPLAAFAEDATQFAIGFAGTGKVLGVAKTARTVTKIASAAARGAVVDAVAFDPDEAQLAELMARAPEGLGIREMGEALSVSPNDSEIVKRTKRGAAGVIPGVALDAVVAGVQRAFAKKVLTSATATPAEKVAAEAIDANAAKMLGDIADGTHVPDGAHVVVKDNGDGTFGMKAVDDAAEEVAEDAPRFADRAEAEAQAETINAGMNERVQAAANAGGLTTAQADELRTAFRSLLSDPTAKWDEGTHFNFSYYSEPKEILAAIESVSRVFKEELDAAQVREGVTIEEQALRLRQMVGGLDPDQAPGLMAAMLESGTALPQSIVFGAADLVLRDIALKSAKLFDVVTARPHDLIAWEEARHAAGSLLRLQKSLAGAHSEWGRTGRFMQERDTFAGKAAGKEAPAPKADAPAKPDDPANEIAGMSQREVLAVLKMAKASGGKPSQLHAVAGAAKIIQETGFMRRALEFFVNSALSSPVTGLTAMSMNAAVSTYEAFSKMATGAVRGNKALMHEGADILYANERFFMENFKVAAMAFRQGTSVVHPMETHIALPGKLGEAVRTPARVLLYADEFTRVTNYRSFVFAKSRRYWRERGLDGAALEKAVNGDLRDAFDKNGVATVPDAMKYAELPTMSADLGRDSPGGKLTNYLNNSVEAKFIAPFVKTSVNIFRYTLDRTPLLNMAAKRNREIMAAGGEAAEILHTQSAMATLVGFSAYMAAKQGQITGSGPKEPGLRKMWLQDHKPYSMKINGEWVSYRRLDPLLTPLSIMADVHAMVQEISDENGEADAEDVIAASLAGIASSFANKSYMVGMTSFFEAWTGGEGNKVKRWLNNFGSTFVTPQVVRAVNDDPYLREVDGFLQTVMSGIPGLSDKLPARYNAFGEPELRTHSLSPVPIRGSAERTVATDLYELGRGIAPMGRKSVNGVPVDLTDAAKFGRVDGLTPYEFAQRQMREPGDGEPSLRAALTDIVKSDDWKEASPGSEMFPGGARFVMAYRVIDSYRRRAVGEMLDRFPSVQQEVEMQREIKGASMSEGQAGALDVLREYGK